MPSNDSTAVQSAIRHVRRVAVALIGATVLAIGVAMIVLPGPAMIVIPVGLGILAAEFAWARRMLHWLKREANRRLYCLT